MLGYEFVRMQKGTSSFAKFQKGEHLFVSFLGSPLCVNLQNYSFMHGRGEEWSKVRGKHVDVGTLSLLRASNPQNYSLTRGALPSARMRSKFFSAIF